MLVDESKVLERFAQMSADGEGATTAGEDCCGVVVAAARGSEECELEPTPDIFRLQGPINEPGLSLPRPLLDSIVGILVAIGWLFDSSTKEGVGDRLRMIADPSSSKRVVGDRLRFRGVPELVD